jgi:hypothetical protein
MKSMELLVSFQRSFLDFLATARSVDGLGLEAFAAHVAFAVSEPLVSAVQFLIGCFV